jgi:hypothetical protein
VPTSLEPVPGTPFGVVVTADGRWSFVSMPSTGSVGVFRIGRPALPSLVRQVATRAQLLGEGFSGSDLVGTIPVGIAPVGLAVSPDGRWLYATSEVAAGGSASGGQGTLSVISLDRAETDPAGSVVSTVDAGCSPVRVVTSADGGVVWVTARESDRLLGFAAARLRTDPAGSLIASVEVGEAPVGLALADGGTRIVVADSNRFDAPNAASSLAVVSVPAALAGQPALTGYLGRLPAAARPGTR